MRLRKANQAAAVDAPIVSLFHIVHHWRRAAQRPVMATSILKALRACRGAMVGVAMTAAGFFCISGCSERVAFPSLQGTTNIVFACPSEDKPGTEEQFGVGAPDEVNRLVSLLRMRGSYHTASGCVHPFAGRFQKPSGVVEISFHNHCLVLYDASGKVSVGWWPMPKEFYAEFYNQARTQAKWRIPDYEAPKP